MPIDRFNANNSGGTEGRWANKHGRVLHSFLAGATTWEGQRKEAMVKGGREMKRGGKYRKSEKDRRERAKEGWVGG